MAAPPSVPEPQEPPGVGLPSPLTRPLETQAEEAPRVELARVALRTVQGLSADPDLPVAAVPAREVGLPAPAVDFPAPVEVEADNLPARSDSGEFGELDLGTLQSREAPAVPKVTLPKEAVDVHARTQFQFGPGPTDEAPPEPRRAAGPAPQQTLHGHSAELPAVRGKQTAQGALVPEIELPGLDLVVPEAAPEEAEPASPPPVTSDEPPDLEAPVRRTSTRLETGDDALLDLDGPGDVADSPGFETRDDEPIELVDAPERPPSKTSLSAARSGQSLPEARAPSMDSRMLVDDDPGDFGELELPEIEAETDAIEGSTRSSQIQPQVGSLLRPPTGPVRRPSRDVPSLLSADVGRAEPAPSPGDGEQAPPETSAQRYAGGGTGYGEVTLDTSMGINVPLEATTEDDMEFGGIPQAEGAAAPSGVEGTLAPASRVAQRTAADARPIRKRLKRYFFIFLGFVIVAGSALALLPDVGPFGAYFINDYLKAAEYRALTDRAMAQARGLVAQDICNQAAKASSVLDGARSTAKRLYALDAYAAYVGYIRQLRFGNDPGALARARVILQELKGRREIEALALARAAQDAADGKHKEASAKIEAILKRNPKNADALAIAAENALASGDAALAQQRWTELEQVEPRARAAFGVARSLLRANDKKGAEAAARKVVESYPEHVGARLMLAELLFRSGSAKADDVETLVKGALKKEDAASPAEQVLGHTLLGDFALERSHVSQAEKAYLAALEIDPKTVRALLGLGEVLYANGRYTEAQARFEAASKALPDDMQARLGLAKAHLALESTGEASKVLTELREKHPESWEVAYWQGRGLAAAGQRQPAEEALRAAIELGGGDPRTVSAYVELALMFNREERWEDAEKLLEDAKVKLTGSAAIHKAFGQLALSRGRTDKALEAFRQAEAADPADVDTKFRIATTLRQARKFEEAEQMIDAIEKLDAKYPGLTLERGLLSEASGKTDQALAAYEKALAAAPDDLDLMLRVGCTQMIAGRLHDAAELLKKVLRLRPVSAEANHCLGRALLAEGFHPVAALTPLTRAVELAPHRADFWLYVGWAASESGSTKRAEEALSKAIQLDKGLGDAYWRRGLLSKRQGAVRDALDDLKKALDYNPSRYAIHASLAEVYYDLGREAEAMSHWARAVAANPDDATWRYRYGRLLLPNRQVAEARRQLSKALELAKQAKPEPRWTWEAHRLLAVAIGNRAEAIPHLEAFLRTGPADSPYRGEAKATLKQLGRDWRGN